MSYFFHALAIVRAHDLIEPLASWPAARLVEADRLGVVVVDLALAYGHDGAAARLVTMVIVQANLAEGREAHLEFKRSESLNTCVTLIRPVTRSSTPVTISASV